MSIRFIIRRDVKGDFHNWSLRDGICINADSHDWEDPRWAEGCDGVCDTFKYFSSALATASGAK